MRSLLSGSRNHLTRGFFGCDGAGGGACVIVQVRPPTTMVPVRTALVLLRLNMADTVPFAVPLLACSVIQPLGVEAVQAHPDPLVTVMLIAWL